MNDYDILNDDELHYCGSYKYVETRSKERIVEEQNARNYINDLNNIVDVDMFTTELNNIIEQHIEISEQQLSNYSKNLMCLCVNLNKSEYKNKNKMEKIYRLINIYHTIFDRYRKNLRDFNILNTSYYIYSESEMKRIYKHKKNNESDLMSLIAMGQDFYLC